MDIEEQYNKIYRYCYMKPRDHHTSEDLMQETFLHFLENHSYREIGKQIFKYIGVPVEEIGYNQPKGVRYPTENPWG